MLHVQREMVPVYEAFIVVPNKRFGESCVSNKDEVLPKTLLMFFPHAKTVVVLKHWFMN